MRINKMNKDLQIAKKTVQTEIQALKKLYKSFTDSSQFSKAVSLIIKTKGKVLVVGVGKSFIVGSKVSSTLSSLGTPSVCFNASDLQHGGLGAIQNKHDILLVFSVSGESSELDSILRYASRNNIEVIGVSCKSSSMLIRGSTIKIILPRVKEAGHSLAPTSSSINFLSWGDALAIACMKKKRFTNKNFISTHPQGSLGTSLILVKEIMFKGSKIPLISSSKNMKLAISIMNKKKLGLVCVRMPSGKYGIISDGDLRRHANNLYKKKIIDVAIKNPISISEETTALAAIEKMTRYKISSLLVFRKKNLNKKNKNIVGILTLKECLDRGIK